MLDCHSDSAHALRHFSKEGKAYDYPLSCITYNSAPAASLFRGDAGICIYALRDIACPAAAFVSRFGKAGLLDMPPLHAGSHTLESLLKHFPYRNRLVKFSLKPAEYAALIKEKAPSNRKRFASPVPAGKERFTVVMDTFQLSRSKTLKNHTAFQLLPVIARDILLKEKI